MSADTAPFRNAGVNSQVKSLRILEVISAGDSALPLRGISSQTGINKSTVHRLLTVLVREGYVIQNRENAYGVGPALLSLAARVRSPRRMLVRARLEALRDEISQTVHMAVRSGDHAVYTEKVESSSAIRMASVVGARMELYTSAIGKNILAHLPREECQVILSKLVLTRKTPNTVRDKETLEAMLEPIRVQGYAIDDEENELSVRCIAVPVFDGNGQILGGVSATTVRPLIDYDALLSFVPSLREAARDITMWI